ncbi:hypothetical protein [Spiroplasma alleghenense]|uniref:Transmembrane protein n=1 Tax=Spiroplasma alleghenense TaxID=216931 RepID=A0A345Z519_9MOLU|nr:hypothetical protein [Spiroplasma alleghenense]AXK51698.1 hypothetical protein SALLE_v1c10280 [Spiroplasma alleghenense]
MEKHTTISRAVFRGVTHNSWKLFIIINFFIFFMLFTPSLDLNGTYKEALKIGITLISVYAFFEIISLLIIIVISVYVKWWIWEERYLEIQRPLEKVFGSWLIAAGWISISIMNKSNLIQLGKLIKKTYDEEETSESREELIEKGYLNAIVDKERIWRVKKASIRMAFASILSTFIYISYAFTVIMLYIYAKEFSWVLFGLLMSTMLLMVPFGVAITSNGIFLESARYLCFLNEFEAAPQGERTFKFYHNVAMRYGIVAKVFGVLFFFTIWGVFAFQFGSTIRPLEKERLEEVFENTRY